VLKPVSNDVLGSGQVLSHSKLDCSVPRTQDINLSPGSCPENPARPGVLRVGVLQNKCRKPGVPGVVREDNYVQLLPVPGVPGVSQFSRAKLPGGTRAARTSPGRPDTGARGCPAGPGRVAWPPQASLPGPGFPVRAESWKVRAARIDWARPLCNLRIVCECRRVAPTWCDVERH
jgi:hypothetical protein